MAARSKSSVKETEKTEAPGVDKKREDALNSALAQVEKQFGKGSAMRLGDRPEQDIEVIPTGSLALDTALGIGGLPRGRIVEIYGPESSGKTTLALHVVANAQKNGGVAAFIDAEHALDPVYARHLGVDTDSLIVSQPDNGEQALEIADMLIRSGALDVIVIDSVAALVPKAEIEGDMGDSHVGLQARLMSQALRKMTGALAQANTTAIFINQLREKIGVFFGSPETTTGGKALKFYASVRMDIRRIQTLKDKDEPIGNRTRVKVVTSDAKEPDQSPFLFNTLNMIASTAQIEDAAATEKMITALSRLFRYNLKSAGAVMPLERELKIIQDYMYLQKMRFGQRVRYDTDCAPKTLEVLVPSFVLQPLVENSIKHGLSKDSKGGRIFIRTWMHNGRLWISVADTGAGMEEDRLKQIRAALNDGTENEIGIGVGNIYRRVRGMYEDGEMHIYSHKGCGTAVQLAFTPKDIASF